MIWKHKIPDLESDAIVWSNIWECLGQYVYFLCWGRWINWEKLLLIVALICTLFLMCIPLVVLLHIGSGTMSLQTSWANGTQEDLNQQRVEKYFYIWACPPLLFLVSHHCYIKNSQLMCSIRHMQLNCSCCVIQQ